MAGCLNMIPEAGFSGTADITGVGEFRMKMTVRSDAGTGSKDTLLS
jgi:hypothetical protein